MLTEKTTAEYQKQEAKRFNESETLSALKHHLPAQAPLKDFIHHNTLHSFQHLQFFDALRHASTIFGYKISLSMNEFRKHYENGRIREDILEMVIRKKMGTEQLDHWKTK